MTDRISGATPKNIHEGEFPQLFVDDSWLLLTFAGLLDCNLKSSDHKDSSVSLFGEMNWGQIFILDNGYHFSKKNEGIVGGLDVRRNRK